MKSDNNTRRRGSALVIAFFGKFNLLRLINVGARGKIAIIVKIAQGVSESEFIVLVLEYCGIAISPEGQSKAEAKRLS